MSFRNLYKRTNDKSKDLFLGNIGKSCGKLSENLIISELIKYGDVENFEYGEGSHSFVSFKNIEDAIKLYEKYSSSNSELFLGRRIKVSFSLICKSKIIDSKQWSICSSINTLHSFGLNIYNNILDDGEGEKLLDWIDKYGIWEEGLSRRVQHYGFGFDYKNKIISPKWVRDIPIKIEMIINRLLLHNIVTSRPDQITINEYIAGQGIGPHIDSHHTIGNYIAVVSLGSGVGMDFYELQLSDSKSFKKQKKHSIYIPKNSVYTMSSNIRYCWQHGIKKRYTDNIDGNIIKRHRRVSLTFRRYIKGDLEKCSCNYHDFCDSRFPLLRQLPDRLI
ncbi:oxidoreductase, 2og-Fe(II) oxygenase family protein [Cryptosporidium muris RN66]|uniref:Oxidoreductase, 2og-Fe(II) oxygenase family protein n=1 Tax=Cryptosporidium muris (strain RN66) TaxID=441375 RepID=B6AFB9_CRYMR|nr:oxidoreductase, 2og-Fe(II) oxygenase family protein [Cryptosporidium muris RN66]EEA06910.1 oxidoreductase, 2og-Fe(II) oxygenase family protein [Cryptosporidium muris RN66]|eukprot:XP_002141259.1 oxidoreductase, 2og-Fe(II) oxygenase family protein [Cryptosporidium muris RN66]